MGKKRNGYGNDSRLFWYIVTLCGITAMLLLWGNCHGSLADALAIPQAALSTAPRRAEPAVAQASPQAHRAARLPRARLRARGSAHPSLIRWPGGDAEPGARSRGVRL
jgi:hypothetical protein